MEALDRNGYDEAVERLDDEHQVITEAPPPFQKLHGFTVICLVLNRTIGSGIFVTPTKVLLGTGSVGTSLLFWAAGAMVTICGLLVWLELGLTLPLRIPFGENEKKSVPRSGGEFNYIQSMFPRPSFLSTCIYGIAFILLGNLSGNAIAFGQYIMIAANRPDATQGQVLALAIGALTLAVAIHILSRKGGILLNNVFAMLKVAVLLAIFILGMIKAGGLELGGSPPSTDNFNPKTAFTSKIKDVGSYSDSFLFVCYSYSGFQQPFWVMSELARPRKSLPKYTIVAVMITAFLYIGVNIAFLCAVPKAVQFQSENFGVDMATLFFHQVFGTLVAERVMAAIIAVSIFGNIVVMTFTASRVKQEIAKEGILPYSLFFATSNTTPVARIQNWWSKRRSRYKDGGMWVVTNTADSMETTLEQTPTAALLLHWFTSLLLIAVTACVSTRTAYGFLVSLYSYVIIIGVGFVCSGGLLLQYLKPFGRSDRTKSARADEWLWAKQANFKPLPFPLHAVVYFLICAYLLVSPIAAKPADESPYSYKYSHILWYLVPVVGLSSPFWGVGWWAALKAIMQSRRLQLVVTRTPFIVPDDDDPGQYVQMSELVDHEWLSSVPLRRRDSPSSVERYDLHVISKQWMMGIDGGGGGGGGSAGVLKV